MSFWHQTAVSGQWTTWLCQWEAFGVPPRFMKVHSSWRASLSAEWLAPLKFNLKLTVTFELNELTSGLLRLPVLLHAAVLILCLFATCSACLLVQRPSHSTCSLCNDC